MYLQFNLSRGPFLFLQIETLQKNLIFLQKLSKNIFIAYKKAAKKAFNVFLRLHDEVFSPLGSFPDRPRTWFFSFQERFNSVFKASKLVVLKINDQSAVYSARHCFFFAYFGAIGDYFEHLKPFSRWQACSAVCSVDRLACTTPDISYLHDARLEMIRSSGRWWCRMRSICHTYSPNWPPTKT